jgi:hypothetical protein
MPYSDDPFDGQLRRTHDEDQRQHGEDVARGAHLEGRQVVQADFHRHEVGAPDQDDEQGRYQVARAEGGGR